MSDADISKVNRHKTHYKQTMGKDRKDWIAVLNVWLSLLQGEPQQLAKGLDVIELDASHMQAEWLVSPQ